ncbi:hypothetical protein CR513_51484, partial [Mucuna pruriens]
MPVCIPIYTTKNLPPNITTAEKQIRDILSRADSNKDGCLSKDELKKAFKEFGSKWPGWRASYFLNKFDTNHDGVLSGEQLDIIVDYALTKYKFKELSNII